LKALLTEQGFFICRPRKGGPCGLPVGTRTDCAYRRNPGSRMGDRVLFWAPILKALLNEQGFFICRPRKGSRCGLPARTRKACACRRKPGSRMGDRVLFWAPILKALLTEQGFFICRPRKGSPCGLPVGTRKACACRRKPGSRPGDRVLFWAPIFERPAHRAGLFHLGSLSRIWRLGRSSDIVSLIRALRLLAGGTPHIRL